MLVAQAQARLPEIPNPGLVYARTIAIPNGKAVHRTHGRNLPHRVFVRSATTPIMGSKTASHSLGHSKMAAAVLADRPNTSV